MPSAMPLRFLGHVPTMRTCWSIFQRRLDQLGLPDPHQLRLCRGAAIANQTASPIRATAAR